MTLIFYRSEQRGFTKEESKLTVFLRPSVNESPTELVLVINKEHIIMDLLGY
jgi:hypothetical protein